MASARPRFSRRKRIMLLIFALFLVPHPRPRRALRRRQRAALLARRRLVEHAPAAARRATTSRRASSCSPARPAPGRAFSRCIAGSCSSRPNATRMDALRRGRLGQPGARQQLAAGRALVRQHAGGHRRRVGAGRRGADPEDRGGGRGTIAIAQAGDYRIWPGPNSNSFTAAILRAVPELGVSLPANAIGRDYRDRLLCRADRQPHRRRAQSARARRASRSAGSRASRSICSAWWPGSTCAIPG